MTLAEAEARGGKRFRDAALKVAKSVEGETILVNKRRLAGALGIPLTVVRSGETLPTTAGPGAELKKLLGRIGIVATPSCSCNVRAKRMDIEEARAPGWCEAHLDEIVGWLREEAGKRKLPFVDLAARLVVRRAIANARRLSANAAGNTGTPRD
jgi:hypothetical protein